MTLTTSPAMPSPISTMPASNNLFMLPISSSLFAISLVCQRQFHQRHGVGKCLQFLRLGRGEPFYLLRVFERLALALPPIQQHADQGEVCHDLALLVLADGLDRGQHRSG